MNSAIMILNLSEKRFSDQSKKGSSVRQGWDGKETGKIIAVLSISILVLVGIPTYAQSTLHLQEKRR